MPNFKFTVYSLQFTEKIKKTVHCTLSTINSQSGIASLAVLLFLIAGIGLGTYLVQQRTNILPFALDDNNCEDGWLYKGGDPEDPDNWEEDADECKEKEETYNDAGCDGRNSVWATWRGNDLVEVIENYGRVPGQCGNPQDGGEDDDEDTREECEAKGGNWDEGDNECKTSSSSNDNYDSAGCKGNHSVWANWNKRGELQRVIEDYGVVPGECGNGSGGSGGEGSRETSDTSKEDCDRNGGDWDGEKCYTSPGEDPEEAPDDDRGETSSEACRDNPPGATKPSGYTWAAYCDKKCSKNSDCPRNEGDGFVNPDTSNWCYGGRCLKLVRDNDSSTLNDPKRKADNEKAISEGAKIVHNENALNINDDQIYLGKYGGALTQLVSVARGAGSDPAVKTGELDSAIGKAQQTVNDANKSISDCQSGAKTSGCSDAELHVLYDLAKTATRFAFFEAVGEGVPNVCTKVDLGLGDQINVKANDGTEGRLSLCTAKNATTGQVERVWRVYDAEGNPHEVSNSTYQKGVGDDWWDKVPANVKAKYNQGSCLIAGTCSNTNNQPGSSPQSSSAGTSSCTIGRQSPTLSSACVSCIKGKHSDLVGSVRNGEPTKFATCSDSEVLNYWCNGGVSSNASSDCTTKKNECASECGGSSTTSGGTYTSIAAARDACRKLVNTRWNDSTNKCVVDCGTSSNNVWYNGSCRSSCPSNTDSENESGIGKYCTTNDIYPFPRYQPN